MVLGQLDNRKITLSQTIGHRNRADDNREILVQMIQKELVKSR